MEYVRCFEELRALQALKDNSRSFAVALPGAESRSLQSRAQDDKLLQKPIDRVARLQVKLGHDEALSVDHPEYRQGLAALRDQQVHKLLKDIKRDVAVLGSITQERKQSGASSSLTRSQQRRAKNRRKRIRQLVDSVAAWQQYELHASSNTD
jgi:RNase H-fold protein (predicted Holliday junction resolvase)